MNHPFFGRRRAYAVIVGLSVFTTMSSMAPADATTSQLQVTNLTRAGLGDVLDIEISHWADLKADPSRWVLYFDGVSLKGTYPENAVAADGKLRFYLHRNPSDPNSTAAWAVLLRRIVFSRPVTVGIGPETGPDARIAPQTGFQFIVVPQRAIVFYCIGLIVLLALLIKLAAKSDILRDRDAQPTAGGRLPFSLGRTQMAFWFVIILAAYVYIGLVNWDFLDTISSSTLALMGISAATGLSAILIDNSKVDQAANLRSEQAALQARVGALPSIIAAAAPANQGALGEELIAKRARLAEVSPKVAALPSVSYGSESFLKDLITDADGVSLHRFQILVWTLTLGVVFLVSVVRDLTMPEFGATLLALMGISSGTYIGFKFPEKKN